MSDDSSEQKRGNSPLIQLPTNLYGDLKIGGIAGGHLFKPELGAGSVFLAQGNASITQHFALATPPMPLQQLRAPVSDFTGRDQELTKLLTGLQPQPGGGPVGIIFGMVGAGKSELALKVASMLKQQYPSQLLITLQGTQARPLDPAQALEAVIRSFGNHQTLPEGQVALEHAYRNLLGAQPALIIADDAFDAAQVRALTPPPGSALIVTSRARFTLDGACDVELSSLQERQAASLLQRICPRLSERDALQIAQHCGCLPLALRIAGSVLRNDETHEVATYLANLADETKRLEQLQDPDGPSPGLKALITLSYDQLPPTAQRAFAWLSVFPGSFDWEAARSILGVLDTPDQIHEALRLLSRWSFAERDPAGGRRVRLHDLMRVFAHQQLAHTGNVHSVEHSFAAYYILEVAQQDTQVDLQARLEWIRRERENLQAARVWLWQQPQSRYYDQLIILEARSSAYIVMLLDSREASDRQLAEAVEAAKRLGELSRAGWFAFQRGWYRQLRGERHDPAAVEILFALWDEALALAREGEDVQLAARMLSHLAELYASQQDWDAARVSAEQALDILACITDDRAKAQALHTLGLYHVQRKQYSTAIEQLSEAASLFQEYDLLNKPLALMGLGDAQLAAKRYADSVETYEKAIQLMKDSDMDWLAVNALIGAATGSEMLGRPAQTSAYLDRALELSSSGGEFAQRERGNVLLLRGLTQWDRGNLRRAAIDLKLALEAARAAKNERIAQIVEKHSAMIVEFHELPTNVRLWWHLRQKWRYYQRRRANRNT